MTNRIQSFSVVIPCLNAADYIQQALQSVANQTVTPWEIIVVDDGSTDDSVSKVRECNVDVHLLHTNRANGAGARNAGVKVARGQWIAFLDADDLWYPDHLESIQHLVEDSSAIAALNSIDHVHPVTNEIIKRPPLIPIPTARNDLQARDFFQALGSRCVFVGMSAFAINRETYLEVGGLDEGMIRRHDIEFWLRVMPGRRWAYTPKPTSAYRFGRIGNLSEARTSATIYRLQALLKNRSLYRSGELDAMIRAASVEALTVAMTDGTAEELEAVWILAAPNLSSLHWWLFRIGSLSPSAFGWLNQLRRRAISRN